MMAHAPDQPSDRGTRTPPRQAVVSPSIWAALDAEYHEGGPLPSDKPSQLPSVGFSGRFWHVDVEVPDDPRLRFEGRILLAWVLVSCLWQGFVPWVIMGLALIAYAVIARPAFRRAGLGTRPWVYGALAVGQLMLACSFIVKLGPLWPFVGLYWLGVILAWMLLELRSVFARRGGRIF